MSEKEMTAREQFDELIDLRDAAIQYTEQHPPQYSSVDGNGEKGKYYKVNDVRGMMADFAAHMVFEAREDAVARLAAQPVNQELLEALQKYGQHLPRCPVSSQWTKVMCNCGLRKLLSEKEHA